MAIKRIFKYDELNIDDIYIIQANFVRKDPEHWVNLYYWYVDKNEFITINLNPKHMHDYHPKYDVEYLNFNKADTKNFALKETLQNQMFRLVERPQNLFYKVFRGIFSQDN